MPFREGEAVFCYHGPLLYEAKVQSVDLRPGLDQGETSAYYMVHYKGWNTKWDEFVRADRVLPINEATKKQQAELRKQYIRPKDDKKRKHGEDKADKAKEEITRPAKRTREERQPVAPPEERPSLNIDIPEYLRYHLVDEWEAITRNMQLPPLPRTKTVLDVLTLYQEEYGRNPRLKHPKSTVDEWVDGLLSFFDKSLGNYLLYRFEREQYLHIRQQCAWNPRWAVEVLTTFVDGLDFPMSEVYGAEHLLRLFVTLPDLVAGTRMDSASVEQLKELSLDILRWMAGNQTKLFLWPLEQYDNSSSAYQNVSRIMHPTEDSHRRWAPGTTTTKMSTLHDQAFLKALYHIAKHPSRPVVGLLVADPALPNELIDALPFLHSSLSFLSPMAEAGLSIAEQHVRTLQREVVGLYVASSRLGDVQLPEARRVLAAAIAQQSGKDAVVLVLDDAQLHSNQVPFQPTQLYKVTADGSASKSPSPPALQTIGLLSQTSTLLQKHDQIDEIADWEDHVENYSNWLSYKVAQ